MDKMLITRLRQGCDQHAQVIDYLMVPSDE